MVTRLVHILKEPYDIQISRPSKWGNPFTTIRNKETLADTVVESKSEAIRRYKEHILANKELMDSLHELEGKVLGCWCISDGSFPIPYVCHGQVLIELLSVRKVIKNIW